MVLGCWIKYKAHKTCMDGWTDGWMDASKEGWLYGWIGILWLVERWVGGGMYVWMDRRKCFRISGERKSS